MQRKQRGFGLMELMVVVVVVAILTALGLPAYRDQMNKGRRADGKTLLLQAAAKQQAYYGEHRQYTADMRQLGYSAAQTASEGGFYRVSVALGPNNQSYTMTATRLNAQTNDTQCGDLTLNSFGAKSAINATTSTPDKTCW